MGTNGMKKRDKYIFLVLTGGMLITDAVLLFSGSRYSKFVTYIGISFLIAGTIASTLLLLSFIAEKFPRLSVFLMFLLIGSIGWLHSLAGKHYTASLEATIRQHPVTAFAEIQQIEQHGPRLLKGGNGYTNVYFWFMVGKERVSESIEVSGDVSEFYKTGDTLVVQYEAGNPHNVKVIENRNKDLQEKLINLLK